MRGVICFYQRIFVPIRTLCFTSLYFMGLMSGCKSYIDVTGGMTTASTTSLASATSGGAAAVAADICSGETLAGIAGTASCPVSGQSELVSVYTELASNAMHTFLSSQLTQTQEAVTYTGQALPTTGGFNYHEVPSQTYDFDGGDGADVAYMIRPTSNCGEPTSMASNAALDPGKLSDRIAHCNQFWVGSQSGNAGQGLWKLVTRMTPPGASTFGEVWQDQRTGLLWSSRLPTAGGAVITTTWCRASGNTENPAGGTDCSSNSFSACTEVQGSAPVAGDDPVSWLGTFYSAAKGGMGAQGKTSVRPAVFWRLPTRYDYEQAEVDGIRFLMPDMGSGATAGSYDWTAMIANAGAAVAWSFEARTGIINYDSTATSKAVRCVGRGQ